MDTTLVLELSKIYVYGVSGLIILGLIWDLWTFVRKRAEQKNTSKYFTFLMCNWWGVEEDKPRAGSW